MIDHHGRVYLAKVPGELSPRDGHYSLQADEVDALHLRLGREHIPVRALNPDMIETEQPQQELVDSPETR